MQERQRIQEQPQAGDGVAALSRLPEGALPPGLAALWSRHWQSGAATRDAAAAVKVCSQSIRVRSAKMTMSLERSSWFIAMPSAVVRKSVFQ